MAGPLTKRALAHVALTLFLMLGVVQPLAASAPGLPSDLRHAVAHIEAAGRSPGEAAQLAYRLLDAEDRFGLGRFTLCAMAYVESRYDPQAHGDAGEVGLLQLHPAFFSVPADTAGQIEVAAEHLARLMVRFDSWESGVRAYNQGASAVLRRASAGANYLARVLAAREDIRRACPNL